VISYRRSSASSGCKEQIAAYVCELAETVRDTAVGLASQIEEPRSLSELLRAACAARSTGSRTNARTARWSASSPAAPDRWAPARLALPHPSGGACWRFRGWWVLLES